jgi:hypothetical protein
VLLEEYKFNYQIVGHDSAKSFYYKVKDSPRNILVYDIETPISGSTDESARDDDESNQIIQIQFSLDKFNAVIFPRFDGLYYDISKSILELGNIKAGHNVWNFDNPKLRSNGINLDETKIHDTMWMFKHWEPALPRGLQSVASLAGFPFAWKHLYGSDMELYGGADVCSIHFILEWLVPLMKARGVWKGYFNHVFKLHPILHEAAILGLPVNEEKRIELREKLKGIRDEKDKLLQELIPDEIKNITPKRKIRVRDTETGKEFDYLDYGYLREPKEISRGREIYTTASTLFQSQSNSNGKRIVSFEKFIERKYGLVYRRFNTIDRRTGEEIQVERWCNLLPFKASKDQLSRYIVYKHDSLLEEYSTSELRTVDGKKDKELKKLADKYIVPVDHEGKETTRKDAVEELFEKTGDIVLQSNLEIRSLSTNINNYVPNWMPSNDGCVHTTWGYTAASGQLDSRRPNILNVSKHTEIGQLFRRIIEAPYGYKFIEADKKSFHVATMGYCANDPTYIRFSQLDPHSIFTSYIMPKDWGSPIDFTLSNEEIMDRCKWIKKKCKEEKEKYGDRGIDIRQQTAKPAVLGNQLELGPRKLYWQNRRSISSVEEAKTLQSTLADLFPKEDNFKKEIKSICAKKTYWINEFGYIQWFFDVFNYTWNKIQNKWIEREGQEARLPVAFRVQSCAFGMLKEELFRILKRCYGKDSELDLGYFPFRLSIHDSLVFMIMDKDVDRFVPVMLEEMNKPCSLLVNEATGPEGLRVGVEYSIGRNWQSWNEESNIEGMRE